MKNTKPIKIFHLFPRSMSLYGDRGNLVALKAILEMNDYAVEIIDDETVPFKSGGNDLVYMGSGPKQCASLGADRLLKHINEFHMSVECGEKWLLTGNAMSMLGKETTSPNGVFPAAGILPFTIFYNPDKRYLSDALTDNRNIFGRECVGFINTSCIYSGIETPAFNLILGKEAGNEKPSSAEGIICDNIFATQLTGPFLVKNPHALTYFASLITGEEITLPEESDTVKAYDTATKELHSRIKEVHTSAKHTNRLS